MKTKILLPIVALAALTLTAVAQVATNTPPPPPIDPSTVVTYVGKVTDGFNYLFNLAPIPFTIVIVWCIGYVPRFVYFIPNRLIPAICMAAGATLLPCLNEHEGVTLLKFLIRNISGGFILGLATWLAHDRWGDTIESKIPLLRTLLARVDSQEQLKTPPTETKT